MDVRITNPNEKPVSLVLSKKSVLVNLTNGYTDPTGFYVCVAPGGTEGILQVKFANDSTTYDLPVFFGWNPVEIVEIVAGGTNTAVTIYAGK